MGTKDPKILFIINPGSGKNKTDWRKEIDEFFAKSNLGIEVFEIPNPCEAKLIKEKVKSFAPDKVVAVGGDGTVKMVAEALLETRIPLGILPAGSANGMAKELSIPDDPKKAIEVVVNGEINNIHLIRVNNELCIHLSDIGFNAYVVKKFAEDNTRGMWGYFKAAWRVLWQNRKMEVKLKTDTEVVSREAVMVVIANATKYGNGVVINPKGTLYDDLFEVVIIKKISVAEILKMRFTSLDLNPAKTELFQTRELHIDSKHFVHFQVDGEVKGKVKSVAAEFVKTRLPVLVPPTTASAVSK